MAAHILRSLYIILCSCFLSYVLFSILTAADICIFDACGPDHQVGKHICAKLSVRRTLARRKTLAVHKDVLSNLAYSMHRRFCTKTVRKCHALAGLCKPNPLPMFCQEDEERSHEEIEHGPCRWATCGILFSSFLCPTALTLEH